jgi:PHD/YefM family antitoxin component YafN of YafNO toxin-antitoxin module
MLVNSDEMIPISRLQKELTKRVRALAESGDPLFILKNNTMEAVLLSFEEYEFLHTLEEVFEQFEIKAMIDKRLKEYDPEKSIAWEDVKETSHDELPD